MFFHRLFISLIILTSSLLAQEGTLLANSVCPSDHPIRETIPILDMNDFYSENIEVKKAFINSVGAALNNYGFFAMLNHGVSISSIDKALASAKEFFDLPDQKKRKYEKVALNRGYKGFQKDRMDKVPDLQEYWHVGREITWQECKSLKVPYLQSNTWPTYPLYFKETLLELYDSIELNGKVILRACSEYMGEEEQFLESMTDHSDSIMRVIHYLSTDGSLHSDKAWKAPHRDPNLITFIYGISMEGLEIQRPDGTWLPVKSTQEMVIVSTSNMLESLTNGLFKSTPHRVINKNLYDRYAIPFFYHVRRDLDIGPRPKAIEKTGGVAHFPHMTAKDALSQHNWFPKE